VESFEDLLREIQSLGESPRIEAKRAEQAGPSLLETIIAFSNEPGLDGGYLLLGVAAPGSTSMPHTVVGVSDPDRLQQEIATLASNDLNVAVRPRFSVSSHAGRRVLVVYVPEAPVNPVFRKRDGLPRGAFRRIGSTDQRCTEDDLAALFSDQGPSYDSSPVAEFTPSDFDPDAIELYRQLRERLNAAAQELNWETGDLLRALGATAIVDGRVVPTVAGILLFGSQQALRRAFPMMRLDYIHVPGREWVEDPGRRFQSIEIREPLIMLATRADGIVMGDLPRAFELPPGEVARRETPAVPSQAMREAIVNALMHRSYRLNGPTQILRYANRVEIRNPGHSLVADDRLGEPGSVTRNPRIAAVMHEVGLAETKGSGIRVMRRVMQEARLSPPTFESDRVKDQFVATFLFHHFLGPDDVQWLESLGARGLSADDAMALVFTREVGGIYNQAYRLLTGSDTLTASSRLRRLRDDGFLEQHGSGASTYYRLSSTIRAHNATQAPLGLEPQEWEAESQGFGRKTHDESQGFDAESQEFGPESPAESQGFDAESQGFNFDELPPDLRDAVFAARKRLPRDVLIERIVALCTWQPLGPGQLAIALGRGKGYLVRSYLTGMVREGRLAYQFPEEPNHPRQRYRSVEPT
jgi:ATP-dependent DNA helicase RecG